MSGKGIDAMHKAYGKDYAHKCRDCCNLIRREWGRSYVKCAAYGASHCTATDWRVGWQACGLFNKPFNGFQPMVKQLKHAPREKQTGPVEGQIKMEV